MSNPEKGKVIPPQMGEPEIKNFDYRRAGRVLHRVLSRIYYCPTRQFFEQNIKDKFIPMAESGTIAPYLVDYRAVLSFCENVLRINEASGFLANQASVQAGFVARQLIMDPPFAFETTFPDVYLPNPNRKLKSSEYIDLVMITGVDQRPLTSEEKTKLARLKTSLYPDPTSKKEPRLSLVKLIAALKTEIGFDFDWKVLDFKTDLVGNQRKNRKRTHRQLEWYQFLVARLGFAVPFANATQKGQQSSFGHMDKEWQFSPVTGVRLPELQVVLIGEDGKVEIILVQ